MRLLKDKGHEILSLVEKHDGDIPRYAILSHTWGAEEVTFKDLMEGTGKNKAGYKKIEFCREQAASDGLLYFWVDTCCIDKSSSTELSEAINSMFRWYQNADKCYVYLSDVSTSGYATDPQLLHTTWIEVFRNSRWFCRGWTLQELIAPASVEFFSREGDRLGSKGSLEQDIHETTGIAVEALRGGSLFDFTVEERRSWANRRKTERPEDEAYSLLGIFNIRMRPDYGEGRENAFERLERKIEKSLNPPTQRSEILPSPSSTVPFRRDADFVDRRISHDRGTFLEQIEQQCATPATRLALVGIGGAGKSQLAIEYCHRIRDQSPDTWVFWIHASNIDRTEQGYREIAERVKIPGRTDPKQNIFELVARWLRDETKGRWLLVLDNLDDDAVLSIPQAAASRAQSTDNDDRFWRPLSAYLPQSQNGTLLITTRTRSVATKLVERRDIIPIDTMTDADALVLLQTKLEGSRNQQDLEELASLLEYMPLAIVQAAAYIQQKGTRYSVRRYIEAFQKNEKQQTSLLNYEAGHLRRDEEAKSSIVTTWQISFNDIREKWPLSADLLSLMSYFDRQGIPEAVLKARPREEEIRDSMMQEGDLDSKDIKDKDNISETNNDDMFDEALEHLQSYSLVSTGKDERTFVMHGLVQLATRKWLEMQGKQERWKAQFCMKLNAVLPNGDHENWGLCEILFPQAKSAERQRPEERSVRDWAQILRKAAWYAWAKGDYREAERMCEKSVGALREALGGEDVETSYSLGMLASIYRDHGRWPEAEKMEVQVMATRIRVLGKEHPETLTSMNNLAGVLSHQGKYEQAEEMHRQVLAISETVLGKEHPSTLSSINNLAGVLSDQGKYKQAEEIHRQVLALRETVLGKEHPSTLLSMNNLADVLSYQGKYEQAEEIHRQVLAISETVLGKEHPSTLSSMNNLASVLSDQGKYEQAEEIHRQELAICEIVLGKEHPETLTSMNNLATVRSYQGKYEQAEEMHRQVLAISETVLGKEHPSTLSSMNNLAGVLSDQGKYEQAEEIHRQVLAIRETVLGKEHPSTLSSINNLAGVLSYQGKYEQAEEIHRQQLAICEIVLGKEHPETLTSMNNLATVRSYQGKYEQAEEMHRQVLAVSETVLGKEHPSILSSMSNLASVLWNQDRLKEAEELEARVLETRFRLLGLEHPDTLTSMTSLAYTWRSQGRDKDAIDLMKEATRLQEERLGLDHPHTINLTQTLNKWLARMDISEASASSASGEGSNPLMSDGQFGGDSDQV